MVVYTANLRVKLVLIGDEADDLLYAHLAYRDAQVVDYTLTWKTFRDAAVS